MTDTPCEVCARPMGEQATFCTGCAHLLDAALADVCAYHGLAWDLDLAITKQAVLTARDGSHPTTVPLPYHAAASDAATTLKTVLTEWAGVIVRETGADVPVATLPGIAAWLRPRVGWLRHHPAGAQAHGQILDAVRDARRVCDRPADRLYAGPCDCGADLYARLDAAYVVCRNTVHGSDGVAWNVEDRRRWLLRSAEDVLATTTEISRALTRYARPVTPEALRGYVFRKQLVAKGEKPVPGRRDPLPLYRLGDVLDILARQAERATA